MNFVLINLSCAFIIFSSIGVIYSRNALHSILFLVSTFLFSAASIFFLENEFLALFLLIIYVGAIMILFLFVVMMLDLKHNILKVNRLHFNTGALFAASSAYYFQKRVCGVFYVPQKFSSEPATSDEYMNWTPYLDQSQDISALSAVFYHSYAAQILISGLILYVATIGVVFLTTSKYKSLSSKSVQSLTKQLSRNSVL